VSQQRQQSSLLQYHLRFSYSEQKGHLSYVSASKMINNYHHRRSSPRTSPPQMI